MKNILLLCFVFSIIPLLSGCWDRVEINDLGIVTAAAIDKQGNNQIELSVQLFIPSSSSSGGGQSGGGAGKGPNTLVRSETGINLSDALSKLQGRLPRKVFWGQCKVIIFGEKIARDGIQKEMDFLLRHPQIRERAYLYVGKGSVRKYIEGTTELERSSAELIRELTKERIGMDVTMKDLDEMFIGKAQAGALPFLIMKTNKQRSNASIKIPEMQGTALFRKDRMIGTISESETRGIIWLKNKIKGYTVNIKPEKKAGIVTLTPVSANVKLIPEIRNGGWKMNIKVETEGTVVENGSNYSLVDTGFQKISEKAFQKAIKKRIYLALQPVQQTMKTDIVGFAEAFYRKYPKQFKKVENQWEEVFPKVKVKIDVSAHIRRQGLINEPGGKPEE